MNANFFTFIPYLLSLILFALPALGQRENNNIYIFDCTGSMQSNHLWQPAKDALHSTISTQTAIPGSRFTVIPFGDNPYETFSFSGNDYAGKKKNLDNAFDKYIKQAKFTHISDALSAAFANSDPNKENRIYLLTDGMPNSGDSPEKVATTISKWCSNHKNSRLFYVALTNGVINPTIQKAIDDCNDAFIVQCEKGVIPQIADVSSHIYTNLEELNSPKALAFNLPGNYEIKLSANDNLFNVNVQGNKASNGKILLSLTPKDNRSIEELHAILKGADYSFPAKIQCVDPRFFIANPDITIHVADGIPSSLTLAEGYQEIVTDPVKWYDSFLWSDAAPEKKIGWDLSPIFKNQLPASKIALRLSPAEGQPSDYIVWFNGRQLAPNDIINITPGEKALIEVQFNHDAKQGKRYFSITPVSVTDLNIINDLPADDYAGTTLRSEYHIGWNPLKTILFWLGLLILAALLLWFLILRRIFFPKIKLGRVVFTGPDSFYLTKKIKGARKVVLTSKRRSQNIFSRIFTGEVRYIKGEIFTPEIAILPAGTKKKVKFQSLISTPDSGWDFSPSPTFSQYEKGSMNNRANNKKTNLEFS